MDDSGLELSGAWKSICFISCFRITYRCMSCMFFHVIQPKPRIDYTLKAVGGSLTAIPGISDMIDVSCDTFPS